MLGAKGTLVIKASKIIPPNISVKKNIPIYIKSQVLLKVVGICLFVFIWGGLAPGSIKEWIGDSVQGTTINTSLTPQEDESMLKLKSKPW